MNKESILNLMVGAANDEFPTLYQCICDDDLRDIMRAALKALESTEEQKALRADAPLLERALRALVMSQEYSQALRPFPGWEWYDVAKAIAESHPDTDWAEQFRLRDAPGGQYERERDA